MSIQTIIRAFVAVSGLSLALAGAGWAEEPAATDEADKGSVEATPPADADEGADDAGGARDTETDDAAKD